MWEPTCHLRWEDGVLMQKFELVKFEVYKAPDSRFYNAVAAPAVDQVRRVVEEEKWEEVPGTDLRDFIIDRWKSHTGG